MHNEIKMSFSVDEEMLDLVYTIIDKDEQVILQPFELDKPYDILLVIPCKGRRSLLETTVKVLKAEQAKTTLHIAIVIVEHSETPEFKDYCKAEGLGWIYIPLFGGLGYPIGQFNRSLCFDIGFLYGPPRTYYMMHDNDLLVPDHFFNKVKTYLDRGSVALQPYSDRFVWQTSKDFSEKLQADVSIFYAGLDETKVCTTNEYGGKGSSILVKSDLYVKVGGYDPHLFWGYAPEDQLFWTKLTYFTSIETAEDPRIPFIHLWHPNAGSANPLLHKMEGFNEVIKILDSSEVIGYIQKKSDHFKTIIDTLSKR
jgi:hypothetical protein